MLWGRLRLEISGSMITSTLLRDQTGHRDRMVLECMSFELLKLKIGIVT